MEHFNSHHNDTEILLKMDELLEDLSIEIQKAISLTALNIHAEEAFSDSLKIIDNIFSLHRTVKDEFTRMISFMKAKDAIELLDSKIVQIKD